MCPEKVRIVAMKLMVLRNQPRAVGEQQVRIAAMKLMVLRNQSSSRSGRETPARKSNPGEVDNP